MPKKKQITTKPSPCDAEDTGSCQRCALWRQQHPSLPGFPQLGIKKYKAMCAETGLKCRRQALSNQLFCGVHSSGSAKALSDSTLY